MKTNSKMKITATETSRKIEFEIPQEEQYDVTAQLLKNNHLKGLYKDYCILNQEFLKYVLSCKLTGKQCAMLHFLLAHMDVENRILVNNPFLAHKLDMNEKAVIRDLGVLMNKKIIVRQKLSAAKYEVTINFDILNPQFAFKNKGTKQNVLNHKALMHQETPYIKQKNMFGGVDYVNTDTGEIFHHER